MAPDLRASEILVEPDSTRGAGFVLVANRRDLLDATRLQLNAAARAYERLLGERPVPADVRLTSDRDSVSVALSIGRRMVAPFRLSLAGSARGGRAMEPPRIALAVAQAVAGAWLSDYVTAAAPKGATAAQISWGGESRLPPWLRAGMLEAVAEGPYHERWLPRLGRARASLPPLASLLAGEACDSACRLALAAPPGSELSSGRVESMLTEAARRDASVPFEGGPRFVASSYALALFFSRREGPAFMRALITAPLEGRTVESVFESATSFSSQLADIDRQWRVWLATFA